MTTSYNNIIYNKLDNDEKLSYSEKNNVHIHTKTLVSNNTPYMRESTASAISDNNNNNQ